MTHRKEKVKKCIVIVEVLLVLFLLLEASPASWAFFLRILDKDNAIFLSKKH
jgi:hypothetical protein